MNSRKAGRKARRVAARYAWDRLRVSFWFAPTVMALLAVLLVSLMYRLDARIPNVWLEGNRLVLSGSPSELRATMITMATSILTTAGVVFTLLTLPLSTVVAQYGSRLLRVFLGDRTTQLALGMFVSTFVYCLVGATSVPPLALQPEGPQLTATVGMLLMMGSFASLIWLVQHISTMLQAPNIAAAAGAELMDVVRAEIPGEVQSENGSPIQVRPASQPAAETLAADSGLQVEGSGGFAVCVRQTGYIQYIDPSLMLTLSLEKDLTIQLLRKPGNFVTRGAQVALVYPAIGNRSGGQLDERLERQLRSAFQIGNHRTPTQDVAYAVNQLVEMAVRAMSPAINDPYTAMTCLDHLGDGLALFIQQGENGSHYYSQDGRLRLVFQPVTFAELLSSAFDMLRHCSCDNARVLLRLLQVLDTISQQARSPEARQALLRQVSLVQAESLAGALIEPDRMAISRDAEALQKKLLAVG